MYHLDSSVFNVEARVSYFNVYIQIEHIYANQLFLTKLLEKRQFLTKSLNKI